MSRSVVASASTVTGTEAVTVPPAFDAVSMYVMLLAGLRVIEDRPVTTPAPLLIETEVAPATDHDSTVDSPARMLTGDAVNAEIEGRRGSTETTTVAEVDPALFVAVNV